MSIVLQVSDPHFGTERRDVVAALELLAHTLKPALLVLSGDITQRARAAQFAAARRFVDRLDIAHLLAIPGNHDIPLFNLPARLMAPYAGFTRRFGTDLEPVFESDDLLVIGLNTTRWWRHKNGVIDARQIDRVVAHAKRATARQLRIVVTHQPVYVTTERDQQNLVRGHAAAVAAWAQAGVHLVLGGHIHLPHVREVGGLWSVLAGTAVSKRVRGGHPNSVNVIRHENGNCAIERFEHAPERGFVLGDVVRIRVGSSLPAGTARRVANEPMR